MARQSCLRLQPSPACRGVSGIATGYSHACAIQNDGAVCWGRNASGQLGNGNLTQSATPVSVNNLGAGVTAITAGRHNGSDSEQSCAVQNGAAWCWGANYWGQLGNNAYSVFGYSAVPVQVSGLSSGVIALTAGDYHTCALTSNGGGGVYCWGANQNGQVGNAATAGCAVTVGGGPGSGLVCSIVPVPVAAPGAALGVTALTSGGDSSCASKDASVWCWGNDEWINNTAVKVAASVASLGSGVAAVAAGNTHACAIQSNGALCWGRNNGGQLGNNSLTDSAAPVPVTNLGANVTAISSGSHNGNLTEHSCAVQNGGVWCWGADWNGQLGNNQTTNSPVPVQALGLTTGVSALASGDSHSCALTTAGAVWCWGYNGYGQVGAGAADTCTSGAPCAKTPVQVPGLTSGVTAIAAGGYETCAIQSGAAKCWGDGAGGALGNNKTANSNTPVSVSGMTSGVSAIAVGGGVNGSAHGHACAVQNAALKCWGFNGNGQLGNNSVLQALAPVAVQGLGSNVAAVSAGFDHTCALTATGALASTGVVWCWGDNSFGQIGNNSAADSHLPVAVLGLPHPAPPSAPGPTMQVGTASRVSGSVRVPINTSGSGFNAYRGFNVHLRWAPSVFSFSSIDTTGTVVNGAYCATPIPDGDGGGVVFGCAATAGPTAGTGILATILLTANNTGCSNIHLTTFGAPDGAGDMNGTYTVDASSYQAQVNTTADGTADWSGASGCAQDVDGDGYSDATEIGLGKNPNVFCRIMRADINGDGTVNIVDLSALASHYNQTVPPAPARDDQNGDAKINIIDLSNAAGVYNQSVSACP